eukprot:753301-Hanusia_phi.AAC.3
MRIRKSSEAALVTGFQGSGAGGLNPIRDGVVPGSAVQCGTRDPTGRAARPSPTHRWYSDSNKLGLRNRIR